MRRRLLVPSVLAVILLAAAAAPALAAWLRSSDPADSTAATLSVDSAARVADGGWRVDWDVRVQCPRGEQILGRALIAERDPASIPQLAGEDQGITATVDLAGKGFVCTGRRQALHLQLAAADTTVFDPATGGTVTLHEPIHRAPATRTSALVQLFSSEPPDAGGFFAQYCAAPNCASESGPRVSLR